VLWRVHVPAGYTWCSSTLMTFVPVTKADAGRVATCTTRCSSDPRTEYVDAVAHVVSPASTLERSTGTAVSRREFSRAIRTKDASKQASKQAQPASQPRSTFHVVHEHDDAVVAQHGEVHREQLAGIGDRDAVPEVERCRPLNATLGCIGVGCANHSRKPVVAETERRGTSLPARRRERRQSPP
jgi:hypothetical protein